MKSARRRGEGRNGVRWAGGEAPALRKGNGGRRGGGYAAYAGYKPALPETGKAWAGGGTLGLQNSRCGRMRPKVAPGGIRCGGWRDRWMRKGAQWCAPTNGKRPGGGRLKPAVPAMARPSADGRAWKGTERPGNHEDTKGTKRDGRGERRWVRMASAASYRSNEGAFAGGGAERPLLEAKRALLTGAGAPAATLTFA